VTDTADKLTKALHISSDLKYLHETSCSNSFIKTVHNGTSSSSDILYLTVSISFRLLYYRYNHQRVVTICSDWGQRILNLIHLVLIWLPYHLYLNIRIHICICIYILIYIYIYIYTYIYIYHSTARPDCTHLQEKSKRNQPLSL
jgi:hypothetical protein